MWTRQKDVLAEIMTYKRTQHHRLIDIGVPFGNQPFKIVCVCRYPLHRFILYHISAGAFHRNRAEKRPNQAKVTDHLNFQEATHLISQA